MPQLDRVKQAASALENGKLVVFPTETVYGIGADAHNKETLSRLNELKQRQGKPFSFHIASQSDLKRFNCIVDDTAKKLMKRFWPGPLTLVLRTRLGQEIGVRMPKHPVAQALLKRTKAAVVAPSANFKAKDPAVSAEQAFGDLNGLVDIVIDAGRTDIGVSSTVLDITKTPPRILRSGSVSKDDIEKTIGRVSE
jgi:L-threonylcarbamoyladenylate synthase